MYCWKKRAGVRAYFLKEFLKLSGIYVQEYIVDESCSLKEPESIGGDICIKTEEIEDSRYMYTISNSKLWDNIEDLNKLSNIFGANYLYYNYLSHLYLYQMTELEKQKVFDAHIKCFNQMLQELKAGKNSFF